MGKKTKIIPPMNDNREIAEIYLHWDSWQGKQNGITPLSWKNDIYVPNISLRYVYDFLETQPNLKRQPIIDLGCGNGAGSLALQKAGYQITGVDIADLAKGGIRDFVMADITDLPFENESYEFAFSLSALHHLDTLEDGLREIYRILKNNGYFIASFHTKYSLFTIERKLKHFLMPSKFKHIKYLNFHSSQEIIGSFINTGFLVKQIGGIHLCYLITMSMYAYQKLLDKWGIKSTNIFKRLLSSIENISSNRFRAEYSYHGIYLVQKTIL